MKTRGILIKVLKPIIRKDKKKINSRVRELVEYIFATFCIYYISVFWLKEDRGGQRRRNCNRIEVRYEGKFSNK